MVFFSCDGCGDVLKKNQVDGHARRCRRCDSVSCADCQVSFFGDDYRKHTTCLTEVERYEKKGPQQKKKKLSPQEVWMEVVQSSVESAPAHLRQHLQVIADLDNVPRKPKQFQNFAANSLNLRGNKSGGSIVTEIWEILKEKQGERKATEAKEENKDKPKEIIKEGSDCIPCTDNNSSEEQSPSGEDGSSRSDKKSSNINQSTTPSCDEPSSELKAVKKAMKSVLKNTKGNSLTMKKLKKAVKDQLQLSKIEKKKLKRLLKKNAKEGERFIIDGKSITLRVD